MSSPECKDSDKIPRLFVDNPTTSLSIVRHVEAAIEIIATLVFSLDALLFVTNGDAFCCS
jgi:hypothetical protein